MQHKKLRGEGERERENQRLGRLLKGQHGAVRPENDDS